MENKFFMTRIKRTSKAFDKGCEVHDTLDSAKGAYYAYLGAYGYGREANTDFCSVIISDMTGTIIAKETWVKPNAEPTPEA